MSKKIRGTKPTVAQRKILEKHKKDPTQYLYVGTKVIQDGSTKRITNSYDSADRVKRITFIHRDTGNEISFDIS